MSKSKETVKPLQLFGYTKQEEDGRFVSICVNLSLFAQGKTSDESMKKLFETIDIYLRHVAEQHMDEWDKYTNRLAGPEIVEEYTSVLESSLELARKAVENVRDKDYSQYTGVYTTFVQQISTPYAQTGL